MTTADFQGIEDKVIIIEALDFPQMFRRRGEARMNPGAFQGQGSISKVTINGLDIKTILTG